MEPAPVQPATHTPAESSANARQRSSLMNHILVVDDEAEIRTLLEEILREEDTV